MMHDRVELFIQRAKAVDKEVKLHDILQRLPGVSSVTMLSDSDQTLEARVRVEFDPQETNPILMKEALAQDGFAVLSAAEHPLAS